MLLGTQRKNFGFQGKVSELGWQESVNMMPSTHEAQAVIPDLVNM